MSHADRPTSRLTYRQPAFVGIIGLARVDITPPVGIYCRNWGAAAHDAAAGVHRRLTLTALSLQTDDRSKPLVLVDVDGTWFRSARFARQFRQRLLERLQLDSSRFIFALTHTHAGVPLTDDVDPNWEGGELLAGYLEQLFEATVDTVQEALTRAMPATVTWHTGRCALAAYRDLIDPDSEHRRRVCGFDPSGTPDDTLVIGRVTAPGGDLLAVLCNYACHPTTLAWENDLISPDFVGAMRERVERATGGLALFLQGASGELAPRLQYVKDPAIADRHGRQLGHAVLATLADMEPAGQQLVYQGVVESGAPLAVWSHEPDDMNRTLAACEFAVELTLKDWPTAVELERQRLATDDRVLRERICRKRDLRRSLGDGAAFALPVWVWRIGDGVLVGNMAESYSWIQQRLRAAFPKSTIAWLNLINGSIGYLPPRDLYEEDVYQVWQTPFAAGSLEQLEQQTQHAIAELLCRPGTP